MNLDTIANVFAGITTVALVATIVSSPNTAAIIRATTEGYANSLRAATLRG